MFAIALMLAGQQAAPQAQSDRQPERPVEVVIIGNPMAHALSECLARGCSPEEEVNAAMNAAAESFAAGSYQEAKTTLRRAISRNKRYSPQMPGLISDLYATYADVEQHFGDETAFRHATLDSVGVLRRELGKDHPASMATSGRVGDMWVKLGNAKAADEAYRDAAKAALTMGKPAKAGELSFRRAWIALSVRNLPLGRKLISEIERDHAGDPAFQPHIRLLRARLALAEGRSTAIDELVTAIGETNSRAPILVYAPPYAQFDAALRPVAGGANTAPEISSDSPSFNSGALLRGADIHWVDIGFWVRPDGRTSGVEILRPYKGTGWAKPLTVQIGARRYAATRSAGDAPGVYRVERFTLRSTLGVQTGSRMVSRFGPPTLQVIDLTERSRSASAAPSP